MFEMKTWEESTKLKRIEKIKISLYILNTILDIAVAIIGKNIAWAMCGLLWTTIAISEYCYLKIKKSDEAIIELLKKRAELQGIIINEFIDQAAIEIELNKIKIPKYYKKPNPIKLKERFKYYKENKKFETPIVIDTDFNLVDGYTSYLIAKNYNKTSVIVKIKRK